MLNYSRVERRRDVNLQTAPHSHQREHSSDWAHIIVLFDRPSLVRSLRFKDAISILEKGVVSFDAKLLTVSSNEDKRRRFSHAYAGNPNIEAPIHAVIILAMLFVNSSNIATYHHETLTKVASICLTWGKASLTLFLYSAGLLNCNMLPSK